MKKMKWYRYKEEEYNTWVETHGNWMRDEIHPDMADAFEGEVESLVTDIDRHAFMIFHLLHMPKLDENAGYEYWKQAQEVWQFAWPLMQAFNGFMMGMAHRQGDEQTLHAIGLSNALMMKMFTPEIPRDEEE